MPAKNKAELNPSYGTIKPEKTTGRAQGRIRESGALAPAADGVVAINIMVRSLLAVYSLFKLTK